MKRVTRHSVLRRDVEYGRTTVYCTCGWHTKPCLRDEDIARQLGAHELEVVRAKKGRRP